MNCPQCGTMMLDQRATKLGKQPDFVCTSGCVNEKGFPQGVWLKATRPVIKHASGPGMPQQSNIREPKWSWPTLSETYLQSLLIARKQVVGLATSLKLEIRMEDIIAAGATIFIAASRDGVKLQAVSRVPDEEPEDETA